ncbi:MAG: hypothetical protein EA402_05225 [Planctomycetota bacterium]|nr:MAG: hypothetical protein EA402_05225 [Planctomycetota bacterium]
MRTPLIATALVAILVLVSLIGCSRKTNLARTYYQLGVSEAALDSHLQQIRELKTVRNLTHAHDSSDKVTIVLYVDTRNPYEAGELMRSLGYTRVRD